MASLARLSVDFVAKTAGFTAGVKKVQHTVKGLSGVVSVAKTSFMTLKTAAVSAGAAINTVFGPALLAITATVGAAAVGIGKMISSMQDIDDIADAAGRLGDTAANVVGLGHAFELTGGNVEGAQKSLEIMQRTIGKAVRNGGAADKIFQDLGLSSAKLAEMLPTDALKTISDRLALLQTNSEKSAAAMAIFGKGAADNLSSLTAGSDVISKLQKDAELLGITFSEQAGEDVGAAVDAIARLKKSVVGAFTTLAVAWAPAIEAAANLGTQLGIAYAGIVNEGMPAIRSFGEDLVHVFAYAETAVKHWKDLFGAAILRIDLQFEVFKNNVIFHLSMGIPRAVSLMAGQVVKQIENMGQAIRTGLATGKFEMPVEVMKDDFLNDLDALTTRQLTLKEQAMVESIAALSGSFDSAVDKRFQGILTKHFGAGGLAELGREADLSGLTDSMFPDGLGAEIFDPPTVETFRDKLLPDIKDIPGIGANLGDISERDTSMAAPQSPSTALRGTVEAMSAITRAQQSPVQKSLTKIAETAKRQADLLKDILEAVETTEEASLELVLP